MSFNLQAAINDLPAEGGIVQLPRGEIACPASITISKNHVTLQGQGKGGFYEQQGATTLTFPAGVTGIDITGQRCVLSDFTVLSASTQAGLDNGIQNRGGGTVIKRVTLAHFGNAGLFTQGNSPTTADLWKYDCVESAYNFGDGFLWASPCTDNHLGIALICTSSLNGGWGFNIQCAQKNEFHACMVQGNALGGYNVNSPNNYFFNCYAEEGTGSSFIIQPGMLNIHAWFDSFGAPDQLLDNSGTGANEIHFWSAQDLPCVNQINLGTLDGKTTAQLYVDDTGFSIWQNGLKIYPPAS